MHCNFKNVFQFSCKCDLRFIKEWAMGGPGFAFGMHTPHKTEIIVSREEMRKTMTALAAEGSSSLHVFISRSATKSQGGITH